jgi:Fic family protein
LVRRAQKDARAIQEIKRLAGSALRVHRALQQRPVSTAAMLSKASGVSLPSVNASLVALVDAGIVREITGRKRNRVFRYDKYLKILTEGTEPL